MNLQKWKRRIVPSPIREWWLERQITIEFEEKIKEDQDELSRLAYDRQWNLEEIRGSRQGRIQEKWIRKARKLMLPVPRHDNQQIQQEGKDSHWYYSPPSGELLLQEESMVELRREVRREQKERREAATHWITVIVGLVGALTGLASGQRHRDVVDLLD